MMVEELAFDENGLIPAVVQDIQDGTVLMVAWMNPEALQKTRQTGKAHFWSRSRQQLWLKGETSGNYLFVQEIRIDCDQDTLLLRVHPSGPACHTGERSCFYRTLEANEPHQAESPSSLSTHPDTGDRIATLIRLAGPPPLHPVALLPGEDWKQIRSICEHRKASPAPEQRAAETH